MSEWHAACSREKKTQSWTDELPEVTELIVAKSRLEFPLIYGPFLPLPHTTSSMVLHLISQIVSGNVNILLLASMLGRRKNQTAELNQHFTFPTRARTPSSGTHFATNTVKESRWEGNGFSLFCFPPLVLHSPATSWVSLH